MVKLNSCGIFKEVFEARREGKKIIRNPSVSHLGEGVIHQPSIQTSNKRSCEKAFAQSLQIYLHEHTVCTFPALETAVIVYFTIILINSFLCYLEVIPINCFCGVFMQVACKQRAREPHSTLEYEILS